MAWQGCEGQRDTLWWWVPLGPVRGSLSSCLWQGPFYTRLSWGEAGGTARCGVRRGRCFPSPELACAPGIPSSPLPATTTTTRHLLARCLCGCSFKISWRPLNSKYPVSVERLDKDHDSRHGSKISWIPLPPAWHTSGSNLACVEGRLCHSFLSQASFLAFDAGAHSAHPILGPAP